MNLKPPLRPIPVSPQLLAALAVVLALLTGCGKPRHDQATAQPELPAAK